MNRFSKLLCAQGEKLQFWGFIIFPWVVNITHRLEETQLFICISHPGHAARKCAQACVQNVCVCVCPSFPWWRNTLLLCTSLDTREKLGLPLKNWIKCRTSGGMEWGLESVALCRHPWRGCLTPVCSQVMFAAAATWVSFSQGVPCIPVSQKSTEGAGKVPDSRKKS